MFTLMRQWLISIRTDFVWELHMGLICQNWRDILQVLEEPDDIPYESVLRLSQALAGSHQDLLALNASRHMSGRDTVAFLFLNRYVPEPDQG